jgi:hypothetical protein
LFGFRNNRDWVGSQFLLWVTKGPRPERDVSVKDLIRKLLAIGQRRKPGGEYIERLAHDIFEYGQLIRHELPEQENVVVSTREIAYRFRERPQGVIKAMLLLKARGHAKDTPRKGDWFIAA